MPEYPLPDPPGTSDPAATSDEPLAAADRAGGVGIPAGVSNPAARYRLGEEIARGGMGVVYRATDTVLGRAPIRGQGEFPLEIHPVPLSAPYRRLAAGAEQDRLTTSGDATLTPNELIRQADEKLFQAKHDGRNRVVA